MDVTLNNNAGGAMIWINRGRLHSRELVFTLFTEIKVVLATDNRVIRACYQTEARFVKAAIAERPHTLAISTT